MIKLDVNAKQYEIAVDADVPLLWVIRDHLQLTGTKFGCGIGACGSCTVHIDGRAERSCQTPVGSVEGRKIVTIEGLPEDHPVKKAWVAEQVPQCGYCQPGQMMQAAELLQQNPQPTDAAIKEAMDGNLCRCGTYPQILRAIRVAATGGKK
jgi:isoquinoline 1-oxidoreductase alpha subunit